MPHVRDTSRALRTQSPDSAFPESPLQLALQIAAQLLVLSRLLIILADVVRFTREHNKKSSIAMFPQRFYILLIENLMKKRTNVVVLLATTFSVVCGWRVVGQTSAPQWSDVVHALQRKRDAVKSLKAEYLLLYSISPRKEREYNNAGTEAFKRAKANGDIALGSVDEKEIFDRVATCRYQRKGDQWREDIGEAFPASSSGRLLNHFRGFDGERYYAYDAGRAYGIIAGSPMETISGSDRYQNVTYGVRFLGLEEPVNSLQEAEELGLNFVPKGTETVNNEICVKYQLSVENQSGVLTRNTVWVCPSKDYCIVRWIAESFRRPSSTRTLGATVTIGNASALQKTSSGTYVYKVYQEDQFQTGEDAKLHWKDSHQFVLSSVELNPPLAASIFNIEFPPGTRVEDSIINPGILTASGADPSYLPKSFSQGYKLKPEPLEGSSLPQPLAGETFLKPSNP